MESHLFHRQVYSRGMAQNLQKLLARHKNVAEQFPDSNFARAFATPDFLTRDMYLIDFDEAVTRVVGGSSPPFPFPSARDYYVAGASHNVLGSIRVPFLAVSAEDDPIAGAAPVGGMDKGWVVIALTRGGGHLGWFEAGTRFGHVERWIRKPVVEWIRAIGEDMLVEGQRGRPLHEVDGFLKEIGRDDIGCKEVEGGGHVVGVEGEGGLLAGL